MHTTSLLEQLDSHLKAQGATAHDGESYRSPAIDVFRFGSRPTRVSRIPILGRALSVLAIVETPSDLDATDSTLELVGRVSQVVDHRFPPFRRGSGLAIGLSVVILSESRTGPDDDERLGQALVDRSSKRVLPLAIFRLNLEHETMALAIRSGLGAHFDDVIQLDERLRTHFRHYY